MIAKRIHEWAALAPDKTALICNDKPVSYAAFARAIEATRLHIAPDAPPAGTTAIVLARSLYDAWLIVLALNALGITTICVQSLDQASALKIADAACVVIAHADQMVQSLPPYGWPGARLIVVPPAQHAIADDGTLPSTAVTNHPPGGQILYTSGTTGTYKKVLWRGEVTMKRSATMVRARGYDDRTVFHASNFGLWTGAGAVQPPAVWSVGGTIVFDQRPDYVARFFRHPITHANAPPHDLKQLLALRPPGEAPVAGLTIFSGGGFLPLAVAEEAVRRIAGRLMFGYGATECMVMMRQLFRTKDDLLWLTPFEDRVVEIVDDSGRACADGVEGDLRVALTDIDCTAYIDDDAATARAFRGGYFHPGDRAIRRADGRIRVLGRVGDVLNMQGQKVAVGPVELLIAQRLGVDGACLFSRQDEEGREELAIALEANTSVAPAGIAGLKEQFSPHYERVRVRVFRRFPRDSEGMKKVNRLALRQAMFSDAAGESAAR